MYNKINISNVKEECCGCSNCQYICPVSAVKLTIRGGVFLSRSNGVHRVWIM